MIDEVLAKIPLKPKGKMLYELMQKSGFIACVDCDENYKNDLDWSHKILLLRWRVKYDSHKINSNTHSLFTPFF